MTVQGDQDDDWPAAEDNKTGSHWQYWRPACIALVTAALTTAGFLLLKLAPDKVGKSCRPSQMDGPALLSPTWLRMKL